MNNENNFKKLTPFKMQVLQSFPFIDEDFDAITNYELLCKVVAYLNETVSNVDLLNEKVEEFQHYFDNLDVQDEINNKLDEMVEDGTLPEIIASYLNSKAVFGFDNVTSMKQSTNLINGSYAQTFGYHTKNDGGKALYKIRTITNEDVVDEMFIIALNDNTLIAELIYNEINVKQLGAYGDNEHDDTNIIQNALNKNSIVYIPKGLYKISNTLNMQQTVKLYGEDARLCRILSNASDKDIIQMYNGNTYNIEICNLGIQHNSIGTGNGIVFGNSGVWQLNKINNCRFTNNNVAIYVKENTGSLYSSEIKNCEIFNYNLGAIVLRNMGSSGNVYSNIYCHNNDRDSQFGIWIAVEDNLNANNLNVEWGRYTGAPLYLQQCNGFISNIHMEGINSSVALQLLNNCQIKFDSVWLNFVNSSYAIFNIDGAKIKIKVNILKLVNNTNGNQTINPLLYTNQNHGLNDTELYVEYMVTNNATFTINNTIKKFGSHVIPEKYNNILHSERILNKWKAYTSESSNTFTENEIGNQIDFINTINIDGSTYTKAICIATGVANDEIVSDSAQITQYTNSIRYPKTAGIIQKDTSLKIDDKLYIATSNAYSYNTDYYVVNINKNLTSASGTYTLYKSSAQYNYY